MVRVNYFILLAVLCALQCIEAKKQLTYNYTGSVIARNRASDEGYAKWSISGKLTVQHLEDHQIFKLDNLKTSIFNGLRTAKEPEEKAPLANTEYITKPFAVYYKSLDNVEVTVDAKEPIWSKNMKKAIASVFHVDTNAKDGFHGVEQTIYGNCEVRYEVDELTDVKSKLISKKIIRDSCTNSPLAGWHNVDTDVYPEFHNKQYKTDRFYLLHKKTGDLDYIRAKSNLTYQNRPAVRTTHHLEQEQEYTLTNSVAEFDPFEVPTTATNKTSLTWDTDEDSESSNETQEDISKKYKKALEEFKTKFEKRPLENTDIRSEELIDTMYKSLSRLDRDGIALLIFDVINGEPEDQHIFLSLLPYIGTEHTTEIIKDFVKNNVLNDLLLIKLLATFPTYVYEHDQEMLNKFKFLMNLEELVNNTLVRHAGVISYATLMGETCESGEYNSKFVFKTIDKYEGRLARSDDYQEQQTYLLGLINLGSCMEWEYALQILTQHNFDDNLRALATFGFKNHLGNAPNEVLFKHLWPIVHNDSENFEVRVATLDLLLSANITEEQFNTVLNTYDKKPANPADEHLANYLFTTIQHLENSNKTIDYIAKFANARLQKGNIPRYTRSWTTGRYVLGFENDQTNLAASLDTRIIGTPVTNALNVVYLSYDYVELSLGVEAYNIYLKLGGVIDTIFVEAFLDSRKDVDTPISTLLNLIKKLDYKMKNGEDIHIDLAVFSKKKAVFGIHIDQDNVDSYSDNPLFFDVMKLLICFQSISLPIISNTRIPSDLGTGIGIIEEVRQVVYQEIDNYEQIADNDNEVKEMTYHYKSMYVATTIVDCDNPLVKTSVIVQKKYSEEKALDFPFNFNTKTYALSWKKHNDIFNWVSDRNIATTIDKDEILKHYCPDCDEYYVVPIGTTYQKSACVHELGFTFQLSRTNSSEEEIKTEVDQPRLRNYIQTAHHGHAFAYPPARRVMFLWDLFHYINFAVELDSLSIKTAPAYDEEYETILEFHIDGDITAKDNDPLDDTEVEVIVSLKNQKPDGHVLSGVNTTIKLITSTKSVDDQVKPHVEHNYAFYMDIFNDDGNYTKVCINREMLYPSKRSDKLSLKPVKPAKGMFTIAWGAVESLSECPDQYLKFTELYTATEVQNRKAEEMAEYKKCKEESADFKYVLPTPECVAAHKALSKYDFYGVYADFSHAGLFKNHEKFLEKTKLGYKIFEYNHIDEGLINVTIPEDLRARYLALDDNNYIENPAFPDLASVDPTAVAYDDYDIYAGMASTCVVTPNIIETFTGIREPAFINNKEEEIVAYVECFNMTMAGLTVQRVNNKTVGFKLWSGNNVITATTENGKVKLNLNGEQVTQTQETQDEELKIYFLENDVIYVVENIVEVYYTTEYISIKAMAIYDNYICGRCSYQHKK